MTDPRYMTRRQNDAYVRALIEERRAIHRHKTKKGPSLKDRAFDAMFAFIEIVVPFIGFCVILYWMVK